MNQKLVKEITIEELRVVVATLPRGKALKHYGLPTEFFQDTFEEIRGDLFEAFKALLGLRQLS
jgi:hypothetical protein